mmetsp:Transcript_29056/g.112964  ORF Transcript_29056/g.112964 Transcript_29056/m.112964 type:complete len:145 (+) Transcript_29056:112-546(+)
MALGFVGGAGVALRKGGSLSAVSPRRSRCRVLRMSEDLDFGDQPVAKKEENIVDDEKEKKKKEIERLRAAEKYVRGTALGNVGMAVSERFASVFCICVGLLRSMRASTSAKLAGTNIIPQRETGISVLDLGSRSKSFLQTSGVL